VLVIVTGFILRPQIPEPAEISRAISGLFASVQTLTPTPEENAAAVAEKGTPGLSKVPTSTQEHSSVVQEEPSEEDKETISPSPTMTLTITPWPTPTPEREPIPQSIEAVLAYVEEQSPTFADDFSYPKSVWNEMWNAYGLDDDDYHIQHISDVVFNGVLHVETGYVNDTVTENGYRTYFPPNFSLMFDGFNIVLQYDYQVENLTEDGRHGMSVADGQIDLRIKIKSGEVQIWNDVVEVHERFSESFVKGKTDGTLTAVVYQNTVAFFLDDNLLYTYQDESLTKHEYSNHSGDFWIANYIVVEGENYSLTIDNLKYWDLDDVDF